MRRILAAVAAVPVLLLAGAGSAYADDYDVTIYQGDHARACTLAERAEWGLSRGDTCHVEPELWFDNAEEFGDYVRDSAPSWANDSGDVRRDSNGLACFCGGGQF